jgi:hypothetical protein
MRALPRGLPVRSAMSAHSAAAAGPVTAGGPTVSLIRRGAASSRHAGVAADSKRRICCQDSLLGSLCGHKRVCQENQPHAHAPTGFHVFHNTCNMHSRQHNELNRHVARIHTRSNMSQPGPAVKISTRALSMYAVPCA